MAKKKKTSDNTITVNKKAQFKFHLLERFEAGLVLTGSEVKSLRDKRVNLSDAYVLLRGGEAWLVHAHISEYKFAHEQNHNPKRDRKLLLHKKEIRKLTGSLTGKSLTAVPIKLYWNKDGRAKVEIALATGKKLFDKRESIKEREIGRSLRRTMKNR